MGVDGESRGVSNVVGVVLLVAVVLSAVAVVAAGSAQLLSDRRGGVVSQTAEAELSDFADTAQAVAYSGSDRRRVELGASNNRLGDGFVADDSGHVSVAVGSTATGFTTIVDEPLGTVAAEGADTTVLYQGGGVWRVPTANPEGASLVRSPPLSVVHRDDTTVTLPLFTLRGGGPVGDPTEVTLLDQRTVYEPLYVSPSESVRITVTSQAAAAWADTFEEVFPDSDRLTTIDRGEGQVTVTYGVDDRTAVYLHGSVTRLGID